MFILFSLIKTTYITKPPSPRQCRQLKKKYNKFKICRANFFRNIPRTAEYITRAQREYHFDEVKISRFAAGEIYHCNVGNLKLTTLPEGGSVICDFSQTISLSFSPCKKCDGFTIAFLLKFFAELSCKEAAFLHKLTDHACKRRGVFHGQAAYEARHCVEHFA